MKKVMIIGASGTIGQAIKNELENDCEIINVSSSSGENIVDINDSNSIKELYTKHKDIDAVICAAARGIVFAPLEKMTKENYLKSLEIKQIGQIDLVIQGIKMLGKEVSFTLTTGILNNDPIPGSTAAAMVNSAVEGFVTAASFEVPYKQRINVVSPTLLKESYEKYKGLFQGYNPVSAHEVALAYRKSVMGKQTGKIIKVGW